MWLFTKRKQYSVRYYEAVSIKRDVVKLRLSIPKDQLDRKMATRFHTVEGILEGIRMEFAKGV